MAPYGKGLNIVIDSSMKKAWRIPASKLSGLSPETFFQTTFPEMISSALNSLHLNWLLENSEDETVEAHIQELLLYDTGGHYKRQCNFEMEQGIYLLYLLKYYNSLTNVIRFAM